MKCRYCGDMESKVIDSRPTDEGSSIRRRRECMSCKKRFTTYETLENVELVVVKKDGRRELFDRNKLINGMMRACEKRPVPIDVLEKAVGEIESVLYNSLKREIPTSEIGELVVEKLKDIDDVAYVRFASVYRQFKDLDAFMKELSKILEK